MDKEEKEYYKKLILDILGLEEESNIKEIYLKIKEKDKIINKMVSYIGSISFDDINKKLKENDVAYYGINGAIKEFFKQKAIKN